VTVPPANPCIYHITHVENLSAIVQRGALLSDSAMAAQGRPPSTIGMSKLKQKRAALPVTCWPGDHVSDYVPFYFCPRSIMLYVIHCANSNDLAYRGGQEPIVHLEADLFSVVRWAQTNGRRWAFTLSNAAARYTEFRSDLSKLDELNWPAIASGNFRHPTVQEPKQAEFLLHGSFPWTLVSRIGIHPKVSYNRVVAALAVSEHRPNVEVRPEWYF
jgi:hypothetical protein